MFQKLISLLIAILFLPGISAAQGKIYWAAAKKHLILRANLDGTDIEKVLFFTEGNAKAQGIALDMIAGKMYWAAWDGVADLAKIRRANLDGTGLEDIIIIEGPLRFKQVVLDVVAGKMYWMDSIDHKIHRSEMNGSEIEELINTGSGSPQSIALDVASGKMYWTESEGNGTHIRRADLDGTMPESLVSTPSSTPFNIVLNTDTGKMYWASTDDDGRKIQRANLDGTDIEELVVFSGNSAFFIGLDKVAGKLYWHTSDLYRANLDGTDIEYLGGLAGSPGGIALDTAGGKIYGTDSSTSANLRDGIRRANLDGSGLEDIPVMTKMDSPSFIALDLAENKMYWTNVEPGEDLAFKSEIQRAELDGTNLEVLVSGLIYARGISLDTTVGKMYWADYEKVQRANLNGTDVEDLVFTGAATVPIGPALDVDAGKMYWFVSYFEKVQRANLDGTEVEDLVNEISGNYSGPVLDISAGKMYWADNGASKIRRANLDGTGVEDLITDLFFINGLELDAGSGKMYWAEGSVDRIRRASLDGSGIENIISPTEAPLGIALDLRPKPLTQEEVQVRLNTVFVSPGEETVKMPVSLNIIDESGELSNTDGPIIGGLEFSLDFSEINHAQIADITLDADLAAAGFELKKTPINNNTGYDLVIFNLQGASISPSNGQTVAWLSFTADNLPVTKSLQSELPDPVLPLGTEDAVHITGVVVSDDFGNELDSSGQDGFIQIGIRCDANKNGNINVADVVTIVGKLVGKFQPLPNPETDAAGYEQFTVSVDHKILDGNKDGTINIADAIAVVNKILNLPIDDGASPQAKFLSDHPTIIDLGDLVQRPDGRLAIPVMLKSSTVVTGIQLRFMFDPAVISVGVPEMTGDAGSVLIDSRINAGIMDMALVNLEENQPLFASGAPMLLIPVTLRDEKSEAVLTLLEVVLADRRASVIPVQLGTVRQTVSRKTSTPTSFALTGNAPNPFNPSTVISYEIPQQAHINLSIYNLLGQQVIQLVDQIQSPGQYTVTWDSRNGAGHDIASGVYLYRLTSSTGFTKTRRMTLLK